MIGLTPRQQQILRVIRRTVTRTGCAPTLREIAQSTGLSSMATVYAHLRQLEARGWIRRRRHKTRAIELLDPPPLPPLRRAATRPKAVELPVLGTLGAAGIIEPPSTAEALTVPAEFAGGRTSYAIRVRGQGMRHASICDGDYLVVEDVGAPRRGRLVLIIIDGSRADVKRLYREQDAVRLVAGDGAASITLPAARVRVLGAIVAVLRKLN